MSRSAQAFASRSVGSVTPIAGMNSKSLLLVVIDGGSSRDDCSWQDGARLAQQQCSEHLSVLSSRRDWKAAPVVQIVGGVRGDVRLKGGG